MRSLLLALLLAGWMHAAPILSASNPSVNGTPGSQVELRFELVNPDVTAYYTVYTSALILESSPDIGDPIFGGSPFQDNIGLLGGPVDGFTPPGDTWPDLLGLYAIRLNAPVGALNSITVRVFWDQFSDNPLECDECLADTGFSDVEYSIGVDDVAEAPVPEPGTWALLAGGLAVLASRRRC